MGILDKLSRLLHKEQKEAVKKKRGNPNYYKMQAENRKKGNLYEKQIAKMLKEEYKYDEVFLNGYQYGKLDDGIDIIAKNKKEILLIQCKNWEKSKIEIKILKEFVGNCAIYIEKELKNEKRKIRKIFVTSNKFQDNLLKQYIYENKEIFEYKIIDYKKNF